MRFRGKSALVTGASEGIGFAIAAGLCAEGAHVLLVARRADRLADAAIRMGPCAAISPGDAGDARTAERAVAQAIHLFGGLDLLVNNAGALLPGAVDTQPLEEVDTMIAINLRAPIAFTRAAATVMQGRPGATILCISSATGRTPVPGAGVYGATKAALNYLVRTWAIELAPLGIRVNGLSPGATDTPAYHAFADVVPGFAQETIATNLIKRVAPAEEIARIALHLLDDRESGYVTGAIWDVDGGYRLDLGV